MTYVPGSATPPGRYPAASAARLLRTHELQAQEHGAPIATMYVSSRGGGIRRLIGSAHRHGIAMRRDPQVPHGLPTEGVVEGPAVQRVATDPDVVYYITQPFRLVLPVLGRLQSYIADLLYVKRDGSVWVREIKRKVSDIKDPAYVAKLEAVRWLLGRLGWNFLPWLAEEINGPVGRQINVGQIYCDRAATIDDLMPRFEEIAAETGVTTFGELIRAIDGRNTCRARAAVHRLIMRGRVAADLDRPLEDWSEVRLRRAVDVALDLPFA
jgi:hypothetical protein